MNYAYCLVYCDHNVVYVFLLPFAFLSLPQFLPAYQKHNKRDHLSPTALQILCKKLSAGFACKAHNHRQHADLHQDLIRTISNNQLCILLRRLYICSGRYLLCVKQNHPCVVWQKDNYIKQFLRRPNAIHLWGLAQNVLLLFYSYYCKDKIFFSPEVSHGEGRVRWAVKFKTTIIFSSGLSLLLLWRYRRHAG